MPEIRVPIIKGDTIGEARPPRSGVTPLPSDADYRDYIPKNMYAVLRETLGAPGYMRTYDGFLPFVPEGEPGSSPSGRNRGAVFNERFNSHYRVIGEGLYRVDVFGDFSFLGDVVAVGSSGVGQVSMPYSFNTQGVISGGDFYLYAPSGPNVGFTSVATGHDVIDGIWINGVYLLASHSSLFHTTAANEKIIEPGQEGTAEFSPDRNVGLLKTQDNKVMVFGRHSTEVFIDTGSSGFSFRRLEARSIFKGIVATHGKCEANGVVYFLGGGKDEPTRVWAMSGGQVKIASTRSVDKVLSGINDSALSTARMEARTSEGSVFVLMHLVNETFVLNVNIFERSGPDGAWFTLTAPDGGNYPLINHIYDNRISKWVAGQKTAPQIYEVTPTLFTHRLTPTATPSSPQWELRTPFVNLKNKRITQIELIPETDLASDESPEIMISVTMDGENYTQETPVGVFRGPSHNIAQRYIARRIGYIDNWVSIRFRCESTSRMSISSAVITYA